MSRFGYRDDLFVPLDEAARRMSLTQEQVLDLVERRALRARRYAGWGQLEIEVEPAITNVAPKPPVKRHAPAKGRPVR